MGVGVWKGGGGGGGGGEMYSLEFGLCLIRI